MKINKHKKGFTLVETLISLTLLSLLFSVMGGLLFGMSKIAHLTDNITGRTREVGFCFDIMRKELDELAVNRNNTNFSLIAGANFISYVTIRKELIARNDIAGGYKRVEWRYFPMKKLVKRSVTNLSETGYELGKTSSKSFFKGIKKFTLSYFIDNSWQKIESNSEVLPKTKALKITIKFKSKENSDTDTDTTYSTAFVCPEQP